MVTIKELEEHLKKCEKIATKAKIKFDELGAMTHPELNKTWCALKLILQDD